MKIRSYLLKIRKIKFIQDVLIGGMTVTIVFSILFLIALQLETVFYFSPSSKLAMIYTILGVTGFILFFTTVTWLSARIDRVKRYQIKELADRIGDAVFPEKPDTILNANQLDEGRYDNQSQELAESYISSIKAKLKVLDFEKLIFDPKIIMLKMSVLSVWIIIILLFSFRYQKTADAFYRWGHPNLEFPAPKPFSLISLSRDIHILGGEPANVKIHSSGAKPDSVHLRLVPSQAATQERDSLSLQFSSSRSTSGFYLFNLPELFQDYVYEAYVPATHFWEAWMEVASNPDTIFVTDRPVFESFQITVVPPDYSKLPAETQEGNIAVVQGLKGSDIQVNLSSNRTLKSAYFHINNQQRPLLTMNKKATGNFKFMEEGEFTINLVDTRGITNRDPVPYALEIIPDHKPSMMIVKPAPITELGSNMSVPFHLEIEDDYGFSDLQVAYEVRRPAFLEADPYVAMFTITELNADTIIQSIKTNWDLLDMMLMPEDEVHFHFELSDNDVISGPNKTISSTFVARVPSLADLYESSEENESQFVEDLTDNMDEFQELRDHLEALNLEALKATDLKWEQQQEMKDVLEKAAEELQNLEKMAEALNSIVQEGEKHDLFSPALMDKFKELSELIQNILPEEMMNSMDELQKALNEMDMKSIQQSLSDLADNMEQIEQDLDRYLEIFRRLQAEQKMDELETRMQQLMEQQNALDQEMNRLQNEDASTLARLAQEEKRNMEELNAVEDLIEEAAEMIKPFSEKTAEDLTGFSQDPILETTEELLGKTMKNLAKQNRAQAQKTSEQSLNNMQTIMQEITDLKQQFQQETVSEMVEKFQETIRDLLYLSSQEEQLKTNVKTTSRNSPRLRDFAVQQQVLQDQLKSIMSQMMDMSKQTFAITPDIGQAMGKANAGMEEAKRNLTERQVSQAGKKQDRAMEGLNEAAMGMFNSIQQMESSGSSSGYEQFLQMMQQMAGQQQGLNQQGMQLALGQMAATAQQQMMQQMLQKQQGIRKSLDQLMKEMKQSGTHGQGDFSGMRADMDKVIKDLQKNRFTPKTHQRQQRILSRMLDSQTSMTQRGFKEQRKSTTPDPAIVFEGPGGLPADMGQRQNLALQALNKAINAGYSREHQNMIKRYFNSLSQIQVEIRPTEADIVE